MVPKKDNLKNPLNDIASAAHHVLFYGPAKIEGSYIDPNKKGNWRDDPQEEFDHLATYAEDTPENDSHIKQLAAHVGEVANQWGVFVIKEGKSGPQSWVIDNNNFEEGKPADPVALAPQQENPDGQIIIETRHLQQKNPGF